MTGLSIGWADYYGSTLPGQELDIRGLPDGRYCLRNEADPADRLDESDERQQRPLDPGAHQGRDGDAICGEALLSDAPAQRAARAPPVARHDVDERGVIEAMRRDAVATHHRLGGDERVEDRFLGRLDRAPEEIADRRRRGSSTRSNGAVDALDLVALESRRGCRSRTRGRCHRSSARRAPPDPGDAEAGALGEPLELVGQHRGVGREDHDDRARAGSGLGSASLARRSSSSHGDGTASTRDLPADGHAVDRQPLAPAVVRLHERADGPVADRRAKRCRCRP